MCRNPSKNPCSLSSVLALEHRFVLILFKPNFQFSILKTVLDIGSLDASLGQLPVEPLRSE